MTNQSGGWAGRILRIDVSNQSTQIIPTREYSENLLGGLGIAIISTPKGLLTDREARTEKVGGEILCEIW